MRKILPILNWIKRRWLLVSILAVILIIVIFSLNGNGSKTATATVERGSVVSEVSVTGKVRPVQILDLGFTQGGRIAKIYVKVGDKVKEGQTLASLDNADLAAQLAEARANVQIQQAKLDQLERGTRIESLKVTEAQLKKAQADLTSYYYNVINILSDAYSKTDDAVRNQIDSFFTNDNTDSPQLTFSSSNSQMVIDVQWDRVLARRELIQWQSELQSLLINSPQNVLDSAMASAQSHIAVVRNLLNTLMDVLQISTNLSSTNLDSYKINLNTARTSVNTAASSIAAQQQSIASQKALVEQTQNSYNLLLAGSDPQDIAAQKAQLAQVKASAQYAQAQYDKTVLVASFEGTVTKVVPSVGDIVSANGPVASIVGSGIYQIEANIAESDIARVKIGNSTAVTLDAYGPSVIFSASVVQIDLSATIIEGVATYKTTFQFASEDSRILPGLTANIDILSDRRNGVLYISTRNIIDSDGGKAVSVIVNSDYKNPKEVKIETGLVGSDGRTEVISGLKEGDVILAQ